jgi:hypothetical protein
MSSRHQSTAKVRVVRVNRRIKFFRKDQLRWKVIITMINKKGEKTMTTDKKTARIVGSLFIICSLEDGYVD